LNRIKIDEIWRGRTNELNPILNSEKKYQFNQIINKNELKGFDYKYILELPELLAKKDNNYFFIKD